MKVRNTLLILVLLFGVGWCFAPTQLHAQSSAVNTTPDCVFYFNFNVANEAVQQPTNGYANYPATGVNGGGVCTGWILSYRGFGVTGSPSLLFQSAPAASLSAPGTFVAYIGTVASGINPNTSGVGAQTEFTNVDVSTPFVSVALSGMTGGTIAGVVYGYKSGYPGGVTPSGSGCPGTVGTPCVVVGPTAAGSAPSTSPIQVAGTDGTDVREVLTDTSGRPIVAGGAAAGSPPAGNPLLQGIFDGTDVRDYFTCPSHALITISASSTGVQVIAGTASTNIHICHIDFASSVTATFTLEEGTGSVCAGSTATMAGPYPTILSYVQDYTSNTSLNTATMADNVCLISGGTSVTVGGVILYVKLPY